MSLTETTLAYREPTISDFEDAFDVLLSAYLDQKRNQVGAKRLFLKDVYSVAELGDLDALELVEILEDPIGHAFRAAAKDLAQRYHDFIVAEMKVSDPLREMEKTLYNVAARDRDQEGRRGAILDKLWDGVGDGKWNWMA